MPRLQYGPQEAHQLLTAADRAAAAGDAPELVALYQDLAVNGLDLEECTTDEDLRANLGMPPLPDTVDGDQDGEGHRGAA